MFYKLCAPESESKLAQRDRAVKHSTGVITCPIVPGHRRGGPRRPDLHVVLPAPPLDHFIWTWHSDRIVNEIVCRLFRDAGISGADFRPVKARWDNHSRDVPPLWELVVTGWAGAASPESGVKLITQCSGCGHFQYTAFDNPAQLIDESQWDGSDVFTIWPYTGYKFVTEKVAQLIAEHRLTGARLVRVEELPKPFSGKISNTRLSAWMPDDRARRLGEPLGIY